MIDSGSASGRRVRRRVLVVGPVPPPAHGVAVVTRTLLSSILQSRHDLVHLDTSDRRGVSNIGHLDVQNVKLAAVHGVRFVHTLRRQRPDVVYVPVSQNALGFMRDALFLAPSHMMRVPVVVHVHSGGYDEFMRAAAWPLQRLVRRLLSRSARVIVLGAALRSMLTGTVPDDRIVVVPNAVPDPGEMRRDVRRAGSAMNVLFLGNLIPSKGYGELVTAVQELLDEGVELRLSLAGGIPDPDGYAAVVAQLRHGPERIRFTGAVAGAAKETLLREADVLVLPTYYENEAHPLVILEAMAAGLPVVSTRHAAIPEMVADGETGLLVEKRDTAGLAAALRTLAEQPELCHRMGQAGRRAYLAQFTIDRWAERLSDVFDSACAA